MWNGVGNWIQPPAEAVNPFALSLSKDERICQGVEKRVLIFHSCFDKLSTNGKSMG